MIGLGLGITQWRPPAASGIANLGTLSPLSWFDAADATTMFPASDGTGAHVNSGDLVGTFADKGSGNHPLIGTGTGRPTWDGTTVNFDGVNDSIEGPAVSNYMSAATKDILIVLRLDSVTTNDATSWNNQAIFGDGSGWVGLVAKNNSGAITVEAFNNTAGGADVTGATGVMMGVHMRHTGGNLTITRFDHTGTLSTQTIASASTGSLGAILNVGKGFTGTFLQMRLGELAFWTSILSTGNLAAAKSALVSKWAL